MCVKFSKKQGHSSTAPGMSTCFLQKNIMGYSNSLPPVAMPCHTMNIVKGRLHEPG
jgi:hypothetical protein